jgi:hypothetical protein
LLGKDAGGLSATTVGRLKETWSEEHACWSKRDLSAKRYVYFWADGIHVQARLEDAAQCYASARAVSAWRMRASLPRVGQIVSLDVIDLVALARESSRCMSGPAISPAPRTRGALLPEAAWLERQAR